MMMMMPVYPGAPWLPKFEGNEGEDKYKEWKEQIKGLLSTQDMIEARKVAVVIQTLTGEAKRQIGVLDAEERDTVDKIFEYLDVLYREAVPIPVVRAQFYGCIQRPEESVSAFILRLRELFCRLRRDDPDAAPSDIVLRDQLLMGLADGPLSQALRIHARRHPTEGFAALRTEALQLATEYRGMCAPEVMCHAVNHVPVSKPSQASDWRQELKREILEDVKMQIQGFFKGLMDEMRQVVQATVAAVRPLSPPPPEPSCTEPRRRYVERQKYEWDEAGRPICCRCREHGHIARFCRANQPPSNICPAAGVQAAGVRHSSAGCGAVFSVEQSLVPGVDGQVESERRERRQRDRVNPEEVSYAEQDRYPVLMEEEWCPDVNVGLQSAQTRQPVRNCEQACGPQADISPGERVWVKNHGKVGPWWDAEPFVVLETVGGEGVMYRICSERGGSERTVHRNALKVCVTPQVAAEPEPGPSVARPMLQPYYGFFPGSPRSSDRGNQGQLPVRYNTL